LRLSSSCLGSYAVVEDGGPVQFPLLVHQIAKAGIVIHFFDGLFGSRPEVKERAIVLDRAARAVPVSNALHRVQRAFDQAYDLTDRDGGGISGEKVATLNPSAGFDKSRRSQLVKDVLKESLWYGLIGGDLADGHRPFAVVFGQLEDGTYSVLAFLRQVHIRLLSASGFRSFLKEQ
jgi:hypothetical protein